MPQLGLGTFEEDILARRITDLGQSTGILLDRLKFGPSAGRYVTLRPGVGLWSQLSARTDLLSTPGAEVIVSDVPVAYVSGRRQKMGSRWRVSDGADSSDPPVGILDPMAPIQMLQSTGPIAVAATTVFQISGINSATPTQCVLPPGLLNSPRRRLRVRFFLAKSGTTDTMAVAMYLGTTGTVAGDTQIYGSGNTATGSRTIDAVVEIMPIDSTHVSVYVRSGSASSTAYAGASIVVPSTSANTLLLSVAAKSGTTDTTTWQDVGVELT